MVCRVVPYFTTLCHKQQDIQRNVSEWKICVLIFCTTFVWKISLSKNNWVQCYRKRSRSKCKVPIILFRFELNLNFQDKVLKNTQISNLMKVPSVGTELSHVDGRMEGRMDITKLFAISRTFLKPARKAKILIKWKIVPHFFLCCNFQLLSEITDFCPSSAQYPRMVPKCAQVHINGQVVYLILRRHGFKFQLLPGMKLTFNSVLTFWTPN